MTDTMQDSLFDDSQVPVPPSGPPQQLSSPSSAVASALPARRLRGTATAARVEPAQQAAAMHSLCDALPLRLRLGTSSWYFPGWNGLVWDGEYEQTRLSKHGLEAYAKHPLLRSVSIDRSFYRPLSASQFAAYSAQVPDDFRFVVKAPSVVADAMIRGEDGRGQQVNPMYLDPTIAAEQFVRPALEGLGHKVGALVFQLSPLPGLMLAQLPDILQRIRTMLAALPVLQPTAPDAVIAVEVRNPEFLTPDFAEILREAGATYCLGLHPKMPPIDDQLPMLRALWPGPLVCRWNLNRRHGAFGYEDAKGLYEPFDKLVDPDLETRAALARVIVGTTKAGHNAYVTINNKAEGSAPLSVVALAEAIVLLSKSPV